jgi:hypothetical protein
MYRHAKYLICAALLAGCDATTQPNSAAINPTRPELLSRHESEIVREPILDLAEDCNGEPVLITGEILHVFNGIAPNPQGDFTHTEDTFHASGTGAGENGSRYVFSGSGVFVFNTPYPTASQSTFTRKERFLLISKNGGANFVEQVIFHVTVNPDGELKVTTDFHNAECRG